MYSRSRKRGWRQRRVPPTRVQLGNLLRVEVEAWRVQVVGCLLLLPTVPHLCSNRCLYSEVRSTIVDTLISQVEHEFDVAVFERMARLNTIVSDNGTEPNSMAVLFWKKDHNVEWCYIAPSKPYQSVHREPSRTAQERVLE